MSTRTMLEQESSLAISTDREIKDPDFAVSTTKDTTQAGRSDAKRYFPPTIETYGPLQYAYGFLNDAHWGGNLPDCLITLQRKRTGTLGYFARDRFQNAAGHVTD